METAKELIEKYYEQKNVSAVEIKKILDKKAENYQRVERDLIDKAIEEELINKKSKNNLYLISMKDTNYFKIGVSGNPENRIKSMQTGNPKKLKFYLIINTDLLKYTKLYYTIYTITIECKGNGSILVMNMKSYIITKTIQ